MTFSSLVLALALALCTLALALTIFNALTIWSPRIPPRKAAIDVSLLIPLRNEARNVQPLVSSIAEVIARESHSSSWEVIALDDQSSDRTGHLLRESQTSIPSLKVIEGSEPSTGWLGKPAAQQRLFENARGRYLVFIDADVRLHPYAISSAIERMEDEGWDFISPYPRQQAGSFLERVIQPLLQWSWFASVPLRLAVKRRIPSMAVANGQFFIVTREALSAIDGFAAVKGEVLEDIELARKLWRAGFFGSVIDGSEIASCRMYENGRELIDGYSKSLWRAFGSLPGAIFALSLMWITSWLPLVAGLVGDPWGWLAFFAISLSRLITAIRTKSFWQSFLLHPVSVIILSYMVMRSFLLKKKGALTWRDRSIAI